MKDMLGRGLAVSPDEALNIILKTFSREATPEEEIGIDAALERIPSRDIHSPEDLPGFARSTVDGFAVAAGDTFGAGEGLPSYLDVTHEVVMGLEPSFGLEKGQAAKIPTGGMLPEGADSVLMLEHAQAADEKTIEALRAVAPGENVIQKGEDVRKGELLLSKGRALRPEGIAVLAGCGITRIYVFKRPEVAVISTGDEVIRPGTPMRAGLVRDMNFFNLSGHISLDGAIPLDKGIIKDDYPRLRQAVEGALKDSDMILITGGSSVGVRDMTVKVIADAGRLLFHGVAIKPGKPFIAGDIGGKPVFGLPGHPAAVTLCYEIFIGPVLKLISGLRERRFNKAGTLRVRLKRSISSVIGREEHVRVVLEEKEGELLAMPLLGKSGLITTLLRADGTVKVPMGSPGMEEGDMVDVVLLGCRKWSSG